eukprot:5506176-Prymnesium_polylepis.1
MGHETALAADENVESRKQKQFAICEMQHYGTLMTRARGVQSLTYFATTLHDVCGSPGWQQNPPFDQWDLAVLCATRETRAVQLVRPDGVRAVA